MAKNPAWSAADLQSLREKYRSTPWPELVNMFGRTKPAIEQKARSLGYSRARPHSVWSEQELQILRDVYPAAGGKEVVRLTGRALASVYKKAEELGVQARDINSRPCSLKRWSASDDGLLKALYSKKETGRLVFLLGRTKQAIHARAHRLGLSSRPNRGRRAPLGMQRMNRGRLEQRIANTGDPKKDWKRVDVIEWEATHGPVPQGHVLIPVQRGTPRTPANLRLIPCRDVPVLGFHAKASQEVRELMKLKVSFGIRLRKIEQRSPSWAADEVAFLLAHHESRPLEAIAAHLGRTKEDLLQQLYEQGLQRQDVQPQVAGRPWTEDEKRRLRMLSPSHSALELASLFGRTPKAVFGMAAKLGLQKREAVCRS